LTWTELREEGERRKEEEEEEEEEKEVERIVSETNERNGKGLWRKGRGKELRLEWDTERKKG
jgi:hypothetical protein